MGCYRLEEFTTSNDQELSAVEQIGKNVSNLFEGKRVSVGTKATDDIVMHHKELAKLESILFMADKFPEVIEAEFGKEWLQKRIEHLFLDQILYCFEDIKPLIITIVR